MATVEEIRQQIREEFARAGGIARGKKLSKKRLSEIGKKAGSTPKKKRMK